MLGARSRARRDDGRRHGAVRRRRRHPQPDQLAEPVDDRREHRAAVPGVHRHRGQRADRHRPRAVRHHARRQLARPLHPSRAPPSSPEPTDDRHRHPARAPGPTDIDPSLIHGELPRWAPLAIAAGSLAVASRCDRAARGRTSTASPHCSFVLCLVAISVVSWRVEGRRKATDRLVTVLVYGAFLLAATPLVSLVYAVLVERPARLCRSSSSPGRCATSSARAAAIAHAIVGTLLVTGLAALISIPIGLLTAIYLVEYGRGRLAACDHVPRRRHDRHPVDRRRPVRLRAVRALLRARASGWVRPARSRCRC